MKKLYITLFTFIAVFFVLYFLSPFYLRQAIFYGRPGIDDYKIFSNRTVQAGKAQAWKTATDMNSFQMPDSILSIIESYQPVAFLVIQNEEILFEKYWEGYSKDSISNSFSVSKSIISLLIGIAIDEGKIKSVDDKVGNYVPAFNRGKNKELSIKNLLNMSSGLNWDEAYSSPFSITTKGYYGNNLPNLFNSLKVMDETGKEHDYMSGNSGILAMVIQSATGKNISEYTSEKIWKPIGSEHDALWSLDHENGMEKAYCCFSSNARDLARFGQLILNKGKWGDRQLVSENYILEATTPVTYLIDKEDGEPVDFYGYQWWIIQYKGYSIPYMRGIQGQYIFAIPGKNAVVVRLGHKRNSEYKNHHNLDIYQYLDAAFMVLDSRIDSN